MDRNMLSAMEAETVDGVAAIILIGVIGLATNGLLARFARSVGHWQAAER